jgi:hypothetical protein
MPACNSYESPLAKEYMRTIIRGMEKLRNRRLSARDTAPTPVVSVLELILCIIALLVVFFMMLICGAVCFVVAAVCIGCKAVDYLFSA